MKTGYWIVIVVLVAVLAAGYLGRHQIKAMLGMTSTPAPVVTQDTMTTSPSPADNMASSSAETSGAITVEGNEFEFSPATISATVGQPVTVTFKNNGKVPHNFTIADLDVKSKTIQPGESDTVTFTPSKVGSFKYTCTVDSHAEKGMVGTLTVK